VFGTAPALDPVEPAPPDEELEPPMAASGAVTSNRQLALQIVEALASGRNTLRSHDETNLRWTWIELDIYDQAYPLSVDIVVSNVLPPRGVIYMLPGGAANFRAAFLTPREDNLAAFFRRRGYLVIGISPREDRVPPTEQDFSFMANWGMQQHREDVRAVVSKVQAVVPLPYELLGHSYGAATALDYAGAYPEEPSRVIALDIYSFDPYVTPASISRAGRTHAAYVDLIAEGTFADTTYYDFSTLANRGLNDIDAGPTTPFDAGADALDPDTSKQLLLYGLIYSSMLPGVHSDLTGLAGDWPMALSTIAGRDRDTVSIDERRPFRNTELATLRAVSSELGSGLISMAFARDYWSVVSLADPAYPLHWSSIRSEIAWINTELGYAGQTHGAELIRASGNTRVTVEVIPDYGHADLLWSRNARRDVWERLFTSDSRIAR
jgi:pimeloyl-ACP methyl ester carboxylesterase